MQEKYDRTHTIANACFSILIGSGGDASFGLSPVKVDCLIVSVSSSDRVVMQARTGADSPLRLDVSVSSSDRVVMQVVHLAKFLDATRLFQYPHRIGW